MKTTHHTTGLNAIQIGLLRMFDRQIPDEDVLEIKKIIVKHLGKKLFEEVDRVVEEKGITSADYESLEANDLRSDLGQAHE
ncbi:hypothetical protein [Dyadobacter fanqingshengii]|uniref:Uncharacterized protein n=1 Tax=Dyadobacter fanqingshengii TaxID=2906443 RepID=A0A9X1PE61_9BACT|nr:hypothetical protein [Dyadobacter fanqingshengii]MCF0042075.1 hypothetical protein [Dyadobacter fanqingshengii]MCF2506261.1 hypothetical protein [Dyadobacter fanqingshengii]USJ35388.1 hypothetical protein NFI81_22190 [Dyadobacter fanqingshengii]